VTHSLFCPFLTLSSVMPRCTQFRFCFGGAVMLALTYQVTCYSIKKVDATDVPLTKIKQESSDLGSCHPSSVIRSLASPRLFCVLRSSQVLLLLQPSGLISILNLGLPWLRPTCVPVGQCKLSSN
jgi:hypothetical protein